MATDIRKKSTVKAESAARAKAKPKVKPMAAKESTETLFSCYLCGTAKPRTDFYMSTDPRAKTGVTRICKKCAEEIANKKDEFDVYHEPDKQSVMDALEYLDKPFLDAVFDSSVLASRNEEAKLKKGLWGSYMTTISMPQYATMRWRDSDSMRRTYRAIELGKREDTVDPETSEDVVGNYLQNKKDAIRLLGYDPFANYPREDDKPVLYGKLVNFIDEETKNDGMKMNAVIQIVKSFNQIEKLNDTIDSYVSDVLGVGDNAALINKLSETVSKLITSSAKLAADNGISVNHNNNKSKGANTLSGKIKALGEIGFREAQINTFDYGSCEGMRQVAEISEAARHMQIGYDENIAAEIKDIKVELVETLQKERDEAVETLRKIIVENIDLKDYLKSKGLIDEAGRVVDD